METTALLEQLVAFDTTSRNSNGPAIDFIADYLSGLGVASSIIPGSDGKANLWARIGPETDAGVILSGHTDCVPVDGQSWDTDPFALVRSGERLFGRGTADMKGFIAAVLSRIPKLVRAPLKSPIYLAFSYDEEVGGGGAQVLLDFVVDEGISAKYCIVGEPTNMQVVTSHKGIFIYEAEARGVEAHSSLAPRVVNAAEYAARLLIELQEMGRAKGREGPFDDMFDIPHTTVHVGVVHSGTVVNLVPALAELEFEFRHLPDDDPDLIRERINRTVQRLSAEMAESDPMCGITVTLRSNLPGLETDPTSEVVAAASLLTEVEGYGKVAYGTEAGLYSETLSVPTVVCGPGSIGQAHKTNEWIAIAQLEACEEFVDRLAASLT